ncbi:F-box domain containing protein, partial [Trema orientale]
DEIMSDDDSAVMLPLETMQTLQLSHGDPVWIKGKKGRQAFSAAIAYDDTCDLEPKIRLNRVVKNDLWIKIGDFVSVHRCPDAKDGKPVHVLSTSDNLKVAEFLNNAPNNVLFEILLRLPDFRSAVQYSSVCKNWYSIISNSTFIHSFIHIQNRKFPLFSEGYYCSRPFTLLFTRFERYFLEETEFFQPFCQVFSEKSKYLHGNVPNEYLNFLPFPVAIIASFDNLVVVTKLQDHPRNKATDNYICNPLTKQWLALPKVTPPTNVSGYGFLLEPTNCNKRHGCTTNARFRVVMIGRTHSDSNLNNGPHHHCSYNEFVTKVFCSEIGQWSEFVISYPLRKTVISFPHNMSVNKKFVINIVASNGILYWLEGSPLNGVVAFDPFNDIHTGQCRLIPLPTVCFKNTLRATDGKVCIGVVKGQLRLSQLYQAKAQGYLVLKVWELKNHESESPSWVLVYNLKLNSSATRAYVLSFDPSNANVVFLLCGNKDVCKDVCRYEITEKTCEKVGELPEEVDNPWFEIFTFSLAYEPWLLLAVPSTDHGNNAKEQVFRECTCNQYMHHISDPNRNLLSLSSTKKRKAPPMLSHPSTRPKR